MTKTFLSDEDLSTSKLLAGSYVPSRRVPLVVLYANIVPGMKTNREKFSAFWM